MTRNVLIAGVLATVLAGCTGQPELSMADFKPTMRWDHRNEAPEWTARTLVEVAQADAQLSDLVPGDIDLWCPGYRTAGVVERRAFWAGLLSALAKHESTWNPRASGGGGRWIGLTQIAPSTARQYGCNATNASALKDGAENLACAVEIMSDNVAADRMVAGPQGTRGLGRDWAPFRKASKRAEMATWLRGQSYCRPDTQQS